jgi:hypothetical protein
LANLPNYKDLTNINSGSVLSSALLGTFFALVPAEASAVFHPIGSIYKWKQTERPAVVSVSAVSHLNRLPSEWLIEPRRKQDEAQNRIEAF